MGTALHHPSDPLLSPRQTRPKRRVRVWTVTGRVAGASEHATSFVSAGAAGITSQTSLRGRLFLEQPGGRQASYTLTNMDFGVLPGHVVSVLHAQRGRRDRILAMINHTTGAKCVNDGAAIDALRTRTRWGVLALTLLVGMLGAAGGMLAFASERFSDEAVVQMVAIGAGAGLAGVLGLGLVVRVLRGIRARRLAHRLAGPLAAIHPDDAAARAGLEPVTRSAPATPANADAPSHAPATRSPETPAPTPA